MGLVVKELRLADFRSFETLDLRPSERVTVLVGPNAVGKTNTVEAIQLLTSGFSFRRPTPRQLVREGASSARIDAHLEGDGRVVDMRCDVTTKPPARRFSRNGKRCQAAEVPESLMSVLFSPDDLALVKRGASVRRDELDGFGRQVSGGFSRVLSEYQRAVEQRNHLLKEERPDSSLLAAWDASVALGGSAVLSARLRLFSRLSGKVSEAYASIASGESLECRYVCSLGDEALGLDRDGLRELILDLLARGRETDLRRQQTCVGPHRDDVQFLVSGRDARAFASQGQQRSIALALKMAEVELAEEILGECPVLLLDDVMSELDERRRAAVVDFVDKGIQTLITTTNLGYFSDDILESAEVVSFGE